MFDSIFRIDLQSCSKNPHGVLNFGTPRGLFISDANNFYWVCDDPEWRFAIILHHKSLPSYSHLKLGDKSIEQGITYNIREIRLSDPDDTTSNPDELGTLRVTPISVEMYVRFASGREDWTAIAYGKGDCQFRKYKACTLKDELDKVFVNLDNCSDELMKKRNKRLIEQSMSI